MSPSARSRVTEERSSAFRPASALVDLCAARARPVERDPWRLHGGLAHRRDDELALARAISLPVLIDQRDEQQGADEPT